MTAVRCTHAASACGRMCSPPDSVANYVNDAGQIAGVSYVCHGDLLAPSMRTVQSASVHSARIALRCAPFASADHGNLPHDNRGQSALEGAGITADALLEGLDDMLDEVVREHYGEGYL
jgi:hypothetical protein